MATYRQQAGILKRKARAMARNLVKEYEKNGIYENFGGKEARYCVDRVPHQLGYQEETRLKEDIWELFNRTGNILFAHGRGNTRDQRVRSELAREAMHFIDVFEWT